MQKKRQTCVSMLIPFRKSESESRVFFFWFWKCFCHVVSHCPLTHKVVAKVNLSNECYSLKWNIFKLSLCLSQSSGRRRAEVQRPAELTPGSLPQVSSPACLLSFHTFGSLCVYCVCFYTIVERIPFVHGKEMRFFLGGGRRQMLNFKS